MGCNVSPQVIVLNKPKTKVFTPSFRYDKIKHDNNTKHIKNKIIKISEKKKNNLNKSIDNIKCHYILQIIFNHLNERKYLQLVVNNKAIQNKLDMSIDNYKNYKRIELEIELIKELKEEKNYFINLNDFDKSFYQIYFDDNEIDSKRNFIMNFEDVKKIKVILNYEIKSFRGLFDECRCIKSIKFLKFNRNNIIDMSNMFYECRNLKYLDLSLVKTDNITSMWYMFYGCKSLKSLDLSNFNTEKVINMRGMFWGCNSLINIDLI